MSSTVVTSRSTHPNTAVLARLAERWRGADSKTFVSEALRLLRDRRGSIANIDITIIAQKPKLAPHRAAIRESLAHLLQLPLERVSVKATTTDHLGFVGREEGICALAIALFDIQDEESR